MVLLYSWTSPRALRGTSRMLGLSSVRISWLPASFRSSHPCKSSPVDHFSFMLLVERTRCLVSASAHYSAPVATSLVPCRE